LAVRRVLVTGAGGQIGWSLLCATPPEGFDVRGYPRSALDIADADEIDRLVCDTDLVVNTAAFAAVDAAEDDRDRAFAMNADAPGLLAARCALLGVPLIHLSSDQVFDGKKQAPYTEDDPVNPINVYGASKAAGEEAVRRAQDAHIILRTSWVFATHGPNFVRAMLDVADSTDRVRVVDDQFGAPTSASDIAAVVLAVGAKLLAEGGPYGTFHYTALGTTSWYGVAEAIFEQVERRRGRRPAVEAIAGANAKTAAPRPKNSILDCAKIVAAFASPRRPWQDGVAEAVETMMDADEEASAP
jgi:dTDP-4-dehydrorhamnose reductase